MKKYFYTAILITIFANLFFIYGVYEESRGRILSVTFFDVGQGDSSLIETPTGNLILIDGGPGNSLLRKLGQKIPIYKKYIDAVILSNPDTDHLSGLIEVCKRYDIGIFFESGTVASSTAYKSLKKCLAEHDVPIVLPRAGMKLNFNQNISNEDEDDVYLEFLFPDRNVSSLLKNDGSIVVLIKYGKAEFYFQGDAPKKIERYIMSLNFLNPSPNSPQTAIRILKAGHHGSNTSTDNKYISYLQPRYAVISAGLNNRYHHPHKDTVSTLSSSSVNILKTYELGDIGFCTDGVTVWRE